MKEVLIINLTRMGDLVQTTPAITGFKERYPDVRISAAVNSYFAEICSFIPFIDRLIVFDEKGFVSLFCSGSSLIKKFRYMENFLKEINAIEYDLALNFTHSIPSAVLTSLIKAKEIRGFTIDAEGFSIIRHQWIKYFFNFVPVRGYNPFHLCDIYTKAGGLVPERKGLLLSIPQDAEKIVDNLLEGCGIGKGDLLVAFQLGASEDKRRWHINCFAELAKKLTESHRVKILLIGSPSEAGLGEEFQKISDIKVINLIGKTNLMELSAILKRCRLLVSNDTGPLHIATAVGTKVIGIFLSTAHYRETGPYGEGHLVVEADIACAPCDFQVECKEMHCKSVIKPDSVFELSAMMLNGEMPASIADSSNITNPPLPPPFSKGGQGGIEDSVLWKDMQVYYSYFDTDGLINYRPLIKRKLKKEVFYTYLYRNTWPSVLDNKDIYDMEDICQMIADRLKDWYEINPSEFFSDIKKDIEAMQRLGELTEVFESTLKVIEKEAGKNSPDNELIKKMWEIVRPIEDEIAAVGYIYPQISPLTTMFVRERTTLEGEDIIVLSRNACTMYNNLRKHVSLLINIIEGFKTSVEDTTS
jgi:ADP-heptose:LPS heptosyltransferase